MSIQNTRLVLKTYRDFFRNWVMQKLNEPFAPALPVPIGVVLFICVFSSVVSTIAALLLR